MPFDSELIVQVIQSQWFPSSNRQKADLDTAARVFADQSIPLPMVLLTITAVNRFLQGAIYSLYVQLDWTCATWMELRWPSFCSPDVQWRSLKDKVPVYSIEIAFIFILLSSYIGFEEAWNQIADASPSWKAQWPRKIYQKIVYVPFLIVGP